MEHILWLGPLAVPAAIRMGIVLWVIEAIEFWLRIFLSNSQPVFFLIAQTTPPLS